MRCALDVNILLYASDTAGPCHAAAGTFLGNRSRSDGRCSGFIAGQTQRETVHTRNEDHGAGCSGVLGVGDDG